MLEQDEKKILYDLYKEYIARRNVGISKEEARKFKTAVSVAENFFPDWVFSDVDDTLRTLERKHFLVALYSDNRMSDIELTSDTIVMMENLPKETLLNVASFISQFIP